MKTAISLPDDLFEQAEIAAKELGISRSKLMRTALESFLQARRDDVISGAINRYVDKHGPLHAEDEVWLAHSRKTILENTEWEG